ncbi:MAG: pyridoxamine 5'-phosphate oxidase family protein [Microbacteriaceae bacterium]
MNIQTWLVDIPTEECYRLLRTSVTGRLGVVVQGRPEIFPVSHVFDAESNCVAFPTGGHTKFRAALDWPWVAFEVDGMDEDQRGAWSVHLIGVAEEITDLAVIERLTQLRHVNWITGPSVHWLRVVAQQVTGRRVIGASSL